MSDPNPYISSVRVVTIGAHDHISVWNRGAHAGSLCVQKGDGPFIAQLLVGEDSSVTMYADGSTEHRPLTEAEMLESDQGPERSKRRVRT